VRFASWRKRRRFTEGARHLGFFAPIFYRAILIDAKRQKRCVDGI
jgi:hypothetical protein